MFGVSVQGLVVGSVVLDLVIVACLVCFPEVAFCKGRRQQFGPLRLRGTDAKWRARNWGSLVSNAKKVVEK